MIFHLKENLDIKGFSHITGGGIVGNTKRILREGLSLKINWDAWVLPGIFKLIQSTGNISDEEMRRVFNIGIGLIAVVDKNDVQSAVKLANELNENPVILGEVE